MTLYSSSAKKYTTAYSMVFERRQLSHLLPKATLLSKIDGVPLAVRVHVQICIMMYAL
jgi:hypothetical protein